MEFRKYQPGDLPVLIHDEGIKLIANDRYVDAELSWTLYDRQIVACGGFTNLWPGVYEAWLHVDSYLSFLHYKICLIKKLRTEINKLDFHRLQAVVDAATINHQRFMNLLGFKIEGILEQYDWKKHDHIMYARLK